MAIVYTNTHMENYIFFEGDRIFKGIMEKMVEGVGFFLQRKQKDPVLLCFRCFSQEM